MPNNAKSRLRSPSAPAARRKALAKRAARLAKHVAAVWIDARSLSLREPTRQPPPGQTSFIASEHPHP